MDLFQQIADLLHLIAIIALLLKIIVNKNCTGISYRTQQLFLIVFLCRYTNIFFHEFNSQYALIYKFIYISLTFSIICLLRCKKPYCLTFDRDADSFPHYYLYLIAVIATIIYHKLQLNLQNSLWSFSIWLQTMSILPQLFMVYKLKNISRVIICIVVLLGIYKGLYICHWLYYWYDSNVNWLSMIGGILQSAVYCDFLLFKLCSHRFLFVTGILFKYFQKEDNEYAQRIKMRENKDTIQTNQSPAIVLKEQINFQPIQTDNGKSYLQQHQTLNTKSILKYQKDLDQQKINLRQILRE